MVRVMRRDGGHIRPLIRFDKLSHYMVNGPITTLQLILKYYKTVYI